MSAEMVTLYPEPRWHRSMYPSYFTDSYLGEDTPEVMEAMGIHLDDSDLEDFFG